MDPSKQVVEYMYVSSGPGGCSSALLGVQSTKKSEQLYSANSQEETPKMSDFKAEN